MRWLLVLSVLQSVVLGERLAGQQPAVDRTAHIAVLAHRGTPGFHETWEPLRRYLAASVSGWAFEFVPVTLVSAHNALETGEADFLITNPGHFVTLNDSFPMSVLATRNRTLTDGSRSTEFGSTIFVLELSNIRTLGDVSGKSVAAVDRDAFGGFQMAWREFRQAGVDPFRDFGTLSFVGFPQDQIVARVLEGAADVGIVRSGLLEALSQETGLDLSRLRVLNANIQFTYPEQVSTRLYPEWPFLAVSAADPALRDAVALALLSTQNLSDDDMNGMKHRWSAPVPYHAAEELVVAYSGRDRTGQAAFDPVIGWLILLVPLILAVGTAAVLVRRGTRRQAGLAAPGGTPAESPAQAQDMTDLTPREREILSLITEGQSTKEIANALGISPKTVEFHRSNLLKKYDAKSSLQLVKLAGMTQT